MGKVEASDEHLVIAADGKTLQKVKTIRRMPEDKRWSKEALENITALPWSEDETRMLDQPVAIRRKYITRSLGAEHGGLFVGGVLGGGEHLGAARGVDGGHLYAKVGGGDDGLGHGVGDVVELQVEKHFRAGRAEFTDDVRPAADKQLLADLERADKGGEFLGEFQGLLRAG